MMVWAGCRTCRDDPDMKKWIGYWVHEEEFWYLTPADVHRRAGFDDHTIHAYTLGDFGVPLEQSEQDLEMQARYAESLHEGDHLAPMATFAMATGSALWDVDYQVFRSIYAGQVDFTSRALRKRYYTTRAGDGHWYLWRKSL